MTRLLTALSVPKSGCSAWSPWMAGLAESGRRFEACAACGTTPAAERPPQGLFAVAAHEVVAAFREAPAVRAGVEGVTARIRHSALLLRPGAAFLLLNASRRTADGPVTPPTPHRPPSPC